MIDLAIAFPVDDPARLALGRAAGCARQPAPRVAVLDRLDVPEVAGKAVELRPGSAHRGAASLVARSARMIRSTMARSSSTSSVSSIRASCEAGTPTQPR